MSVIQVGLVDTTGAIDPELMQSVAAAAILVTRDVPQFWPVQATVQYLSSAKKIPAGVWPVKLVKSLPPGEGGFHLDKHNQPYAEVIATPNDDSWSIDASHETLEMLVDPAGNRMHSSNAIGIAGKTVEDTTGQFNYLVKPPILARRTGTGTRSRACWSRLSSRLISMTRWQSRARATAHRSVDQAAPDPARRLHLIR